ncbi:MAG: HAD hydrolase-like protein [Alphaproteobacteria bacterium]
MSSAGPGSPTSAPIRNLLFDLDGTLSDPVVGIVTSVRYALDRLGKPAPADLNWVIGPPLRGAFAILIDNDAPVAVEEAMTLYRERFADVGLFENEVYPGIPELLAEEHGSGRKLFVATSKPHVYARRIVEHFGLARYFVAVHGCELDGTRSEKADLIAYLLDQERLSEADTVMIGDRRHDIAGAKAVGLRSVAAGYGYGSADELAAARPDWTCATVAELTAWCQAHRSQ